MGKGLPRSNSRGAAQRQEIIKQTVVVNNVTFQATGATGVVVFGTVVIGDLPQGNLLFLGAVSYLAISGPGGNANLADTWNGNMSIGSAPTADNALAGAEVDLIPSTALGAATAEVHTRLCAVNPTSIVLDNTDDSLEINLNVLVAADAITNGQAVTFNVNGEVMLTYIVLGDD